MRIGINVPDRVLNRIKALDPEVNVSKMCRQALGDYCAVLERARARVASDGVDEQVMRWSERRHEEPDWVGYALDDARDWVNAISLRGWSSFFRFYDSLKSTGKDEDGLGRASQSIMVAGEFWTRSSEMRSTQWFDQQYPANPAVNHFTKARDEYTRAWFGYVNEVRRKQLQYVAERAERERAERERARSARPEPEVPPQLRY